MVSQINRNLTVCSKVCLGWYQGKPQSLHYWTYVRGIHQWPVDSPHKGPVSHNAIMSCALNTLRPRQNGHHFTDDIFKRIFLNENVRIPIKISLKFVPKGPMNNIPALVQIMAWRRPGDKPLSEPMMVSLPTHICVTRPQWVKDWPDFYLYYLCAVCNIISCCQQHCVSQFYTSLKCYNLGFVKQILFNFNLGNLCQW